MYRVSSTAGIEGKDSCENDLLAVGCFQADSLLVEISQIRSIPFLEVVGDTIS